MKRFFLSGIVAFFLLGWLYLPLAFGQTPRQMGADEETGRSPPALQYAVASLATMLVLVILCMPTRKRQGK